MRSTACDWCIKVRAWFEASLRGRLHGASSTGGHHPNGEEEEEVRILCNMLLFGPASVGKTSLRNRWCEGRYTPDLQPTLGVDFNVKTLELVGGDRPATVRVNLYDTSGNASFMRMGGAYLQAFHGVVFVYDVTDRASLAGIRDFVLDFATQACIGGRRGQGSMALVGNKSDCSAAKRQVSYEEGAQSAREMGMRFFEASAMNGSGVHAALMATAEAALVACVRTDNERVSAGLREGAGLPQRLGRLRCKGADDHSGGAGSSGGSVEVVGNLRHSEKAREENARESTRGGAATGEAARFTFGASQSLREDALEAAVAVPDAPGAWKGYAAPAAQPHARINLLGGFSNGFVGFGGNANGGGGESSESPFIFGARQNSSSAKRGGAASGATSADVARSRQSATNPALGDVSCEAEARRRRSKSPQPPRCFSSPPRNLRRDSSLSPPSVAKSLAVLGARNASLSPARPGEADSDSSSSSGGGEEVGTGSVYSGSCRTAAWSPGRSLTAANAGDAELDEEGPNYLDPATAVPLLVLAPNGGGSGEGYVANSASQQLKEASSFLLGAWGVEKRDRVRRVGSTSPPRRSQSPLRGKRVRGS